MPGETAGTAREAAVAGNGGTPAPTVREATFDVLRTLGLTTIFSNPGSTEVSFLAGLPDDLEFVLGLHEGSVVGMATGYALGRGAPAFALLHTTAGLGNAVSALATARVNRAPLVVMVGQQDRRQLAQEPFLAGRLHGLAGEYPVSVDQPVRAQDVPGALVRAYHAAATARGPALVIVPMDDWHAPAPEAHEVIGPERLLHARAAAPEAVEELAAWLDDARSPALVVGAGADTQEGWDALVALAEHLASPVFTEAFGARAGFPQDHPLFAGHLSPSRARLREMLSAHDAILAVGAPIFRQYAYEPGPLVEPGTRLALVSDDPAEAQRSPSQLTIVAEPSAVCRGLVERTEPRGGLPPGPFPRPTPLEPPAPGAPLRAGHVFDVLAARLPADAILVEESPVEPARSCTPASRPACRWASSARRWAASASPCRAPSACAWRCPTVPWSRCWAMARRCTPSRRCGARRATASAPSSSSWPTAATRSWTSSPRTPASRRRGRPSTTIDIAAIARAQGCEAIRIEDHADLVARLGEVLPGLAQRGSPLVLEIAIEA